jgi:hypothetical protein
MASEWRQFPNTCVDSCAYAADPGLLCGQAITWGCDCGPNGCWSFDVKQCQPNPDTTPTASPSGVLTPTVTGEPECPLFSKGDGNCDGMVEDLDYVVWWNSYKKNLEGDYNGDGETEDLDYVVWWNNYGLGL